MSRIGKLPIPLPKGVKWAKEGKKITITGPKGSLEIMLDPIFDLEEQENTLTLQIVRQTKQANAKHGLYRSLLSNMVTGVSEGFTKKLEIKGIGYRADLVGSSLQLRLGYSHICKMAIPEDLTVEVGERNMLITVSGSDKQKVGQFAANVRALRPVEPYKGKGIRYLGEAVRTKVVKKAGA